MSEKVKREEIIVYPNGDEYSGISLRQELKDVTVLIFGMRRR